MRFISGVGAAVAIAYSPIAWFALYLAAMSRQNGDPQSAFNIEVGVPAIYVVLVLVVALVWRWGVRPRAGPDPLLTGVKWAAWGVVGAFWAGVLLFDYNLDGDQFLGIYAVSAAILGVGGAVVAGRLAAVGWTPHGQRTQAGALMTMLAWGGAIGLAFALFVFLLWAVGGHPAPALAWMLPSYEAVIFCGSTFLAGIVAFGMSALPYARSGEILVRYQYQRDASVALAAGAALSVEPARGPGVDWDRALADPRAIVVLVLAAVAINLALPAVWLMAWLSARTVGAPLGFWELLGGRRSSIARPSA